MPMDSFKESSKTNLLQEKSSTDPKKNTQKPIIISLIILVTLIMAAIITATTALIFRRSSRTNLLYLGATPADSIRFVCSFARYKHFCRTTISSAISSTATATNSSSEYTVELTPEEVILLSIKLSVTELTHLSSLPSILTSKVNDSKTESTLLECQMLFDKELSRLNQSATYLQPYWLTTNYINDFVGLFDAVGTHQQACLDKLEETGSPVYDEVRSKVQKSRNYMSNALTILGNFNAIFDQLYGYPIEDYSYSFDWLHYEYTIICMLQYLFLVVLLCLMLKIY